MDPAARAWKRLALALAQNKSTFSVWNLNGDTALLSTSDHAWQVRFRYLFPHFNPNDEWTGEYVYVIRADLEIMGAEMGRRMPSLLKALRTRDIGAETTVAVDEENGYFLARIEATVANHGGPGIMGMDYVAEYGEHDAALLERMAHRLKATFEAPDAPFDRRRLGAWPARFGRWTDDVKAAKPVLRPENRLPDLR